MPRQHIIDVQMGAEEKDQQAILVPLDLPELKLLSQEVQEDGTIDVHVIAIREGEACPICSTLCRNVHDTRGRVKRDIGLRSYGIRLILYKRRYRCRMCQRTFTESDQACGRYKRTTKRFREELGRRAQQRPISHVAQEAKVGQRFVQECFEAGVKERYAKQGRQIEETAVFHHSSRFLGIDEFARRKGHCYDTILCDLENQQVIEISEGRTVEELRPLFERLENPDAVEAVSMDMSASFRPAVEKFLPQARIVVDHFHVIQHVMKEFKKIVSSWANKKEGVILLHGKQYLFLQAVEDLTEDERQDRCRIGSRLPVLEAAWQLKEDLRCWYDTATVETAANELDTWIKRVQESSFDPLKKTLSAFVKWRKEILAFFQFRISNGFVEGKNNRTKMIMRQGYGFSNRQHLRLRILAGNVA